MIDNLAFRDTLHHLIFLLTSLLLIIGAGFFYGKKQLHTPKSQAFIISCLSINLVSQLMQQPAKEDGIFWILSGFLLVILGYCLLFRLIAKSEHSKKLQKE